MRFRIYRFDPGQDRKPRLLQQLLPFPVWNPEKYIGPAGLLQAERFVVDSRDRATGERLAYLDGVYKLYRCRKIMNCTEVCPKHLNPARAIGHIKVQQIRRSA